jgi:hypothetical protein
VCPRVTAGGVGSVRVLGWRVAVKKSVVFPATF